MRGLAIERRDWKGRAGYREEGLVREGWLYRGGTD